MATKNKAKDTRDPLTGRQREVLNFISRFCKERGYSPSFRDVMAGMKILSPNGVKCHFEALIRKGYLVIPLSNGRKVGHSMRVIE